MNKFTNSNIPCIESQNTQQTKNQKNLQSNERKVSPATDPVEVDLQIKKIKTHRQESIDQVQRGKRQTVRPG